MQFDFARAVGLLVAIVAVGVAGLAAGDMMETSTVLMMVLPSMVVFAAISFYIGMKHGEYRASQ